MAKKISWCGLLIAGALCITSPAFGRGQQCGVVADGSSLLACPSCGGDEEEKKEGDGQAVPTNANLKADDDDRVGPGEESPDKNPL
jgi:hypothetical protein